MARVAYIVNDELGALCELLGITGYELLGGHYAFTNEDSYNTAKNAADTAIWALLDDEDPSNDDTAYGYMDMLEETNYTIMYWSTEKNGWI